MMRATASTGRGWFALCRSSSFVFFRRAGSGVALRTTAYLARFPACLSASLRALNRCCAVPAARSTAFFCIVLTGSTAWARSGARVRRAAREYGFHRTRLHDVYLLRVRCMVEAGSSGTHCRYDAFDAPACRPSSGPACASIRFFTPSFGLDAGGPKRAPSASLLHCLAVRPSRDTRADTKPLQCCRHGARRPTTHPQPIPSIPSPPRVVYPW